MLATILRGLLLLTPAICGRQLSRLETVLIADNPIVGGENTTKSLNVSSCPGTTCIFCWLKCRFPNAFWEDILLLHCLRRRTALQPSSILLDLHAMLLDKTSRTLLSK